MDLAGQSIAPEIIGKCITFGLNGVQLIATLGNQFVFFLYIEQRVGAGGRGLVVTGGHLITIPFLNWLR